MKDDLSIKIKIFDRMYPMQIHSNDEFLIRNASQSINNKIAKYKSLYKTDDRQDLLSIIALETFIEFEKYKLHTSHTIKNIDTNLETIKTNFNRIKELELQKVDLEE